MHIAIIPDGNRRWAKRRNLPVWEGHRKGAEVITELVDHAYERGVDCLSLWGSSRENLRKRPLSEKRALLEIYSEYFRKLRDAIDKDERKARIRVVGKYREDLPVELVDLIEDCQGASAHYTERTLAILLAYSGTDEMLTAVRQIVSEGLPAEEVTAETLKSHLLSAELPSVDLMIRTGGEPHLSAGFLMWQMADAQLYFTEDLFPDFTPDKFDAALADFRSRERRLGK